MEFIPQTSYLRQIVPSYAICEAYDKGELPPILAAERDYWRKLISESSDQLALLDMLGQRFTCSLDFYVWIQTVVDAAILAKMYQRACKQFADYKSNESDWPGVKVSERDYQYIFGDEKWNMLDSECRNLMIAISLFLANTSSEKEVCYVLEHDFSLADSFDEHIGRLISHHPQLFDYLVGKGLGKMDQNRLRGILKHVDFDEHLLQGFIALGVKVRGLLLDCFIGHQPEQLLLLKKYGLSIDLSASDGPRLRGLIMQQNNGVHRLLGIETLELLAEEGADWQKLADYMEKDSQWFEEHIDQMFLAQGPAESKLLLWSYMGPRVDKYVKERYPDWLK